MHILFGTEPLQNYDHVFTWIMELSSCCFGVADGSKLAELHTYIHVLYSLNNHSHLCLWIKWKSVPCVQPRSVFSLISPRPERYMCLHALVCVFACLSVSHKVYFIHSEWTFRVQKKKQKCLFTVHSFGFWNTIWRMRAIFSLCRFP